jgi:uncharacterized protein YkwD
VRLFRGAPVPRFQLALILGTATVVTLSMMPATPKASLSESEPIGTYSFTNGEHCFLRKINNMRRRNGKRRLDSDKQLGYVARRHARGMASNRSIYHDGDLGRTVTRWRRLGQNVGRGGGCKRLFKAFKNSSGHRANILGRWKFMGVGLDRRGGDIFVMHIFQARRNPGNVYHYP